MVYVLSVQEFHKFLEDIWQHSNFPRNLHVVAVEEICPLKIYLDCEQLDTQSEFEELISLTKDIREFLWGPECSLCQSTAVGAWCEWDVEGDFPTRFCYHPLLVQVWNKPGYVDHQSDC